MENIKDTDGQTITTTPHPLGNQLLCGINTFGCDSIIQTENGDVWRFQYCGNSWTENRKEFYFLKYKNDGTISDDGKWFSEGEIKSSSRVLLK